MTAAAILAELEQIDRRRVTLMDQLKAALAGNLATMPNAPPVAPLDPGPPGLELSDLIEAAAAAAIARKAKSTLNSWCRANAFDGVDGFAVKLGGRWLVSKSRLLKRLASVSRD